MERNEFIKSLGLGLALICTGSCMSGCTKADDNPGEPGNPGKPGGGSGATVDLSSQIKTVGEQTTVNGVLFFRVATGNTPASFVATEAVCPHQQGTLVWKQADNKIQCQSHFSEYSSNGTVLQGPQGGVAGQTRMLKIYATAISGNTLTATVA